jgi:hypothetical protein
MYEMKTDSQPYAVSVSESGDAPGTYTFTFVPKEIREGGPGAARTAAGPYIVDVRADNDDMTFKWRNGPPSAQHVDQQRFEQDARSRLAKRKAWIACVSELADQVERWGKELGWSSRRIDKRLDDSQIGTHQVPALLLQADLVRVLLDPVSPHAPGAEGIVDLYLMPGYDDVASLYHCDGKWQLHYVFPRSGAVAGVREAESTPLSKETFSAVLEAMKKHGQ